MVDVLKAFYSIHYNFAALSVLILFLTIFFFSKKNMVGGVIALAVLLVFNVFLFKRTDGKAWTLTIDPPENQVDAFGYKPQPQTMTFSVRKNWTITDEKGETHHWCWVDDYWDKFANTDIVAGIWGENAGKKLAKSSEVRDSGATE